MSDVSPRPALAELQGVVERVTLECLCYTPMQKPGQGQFSLVPQKRYDWLRPGSLSASDPRCFLGVFVRAES